MPKSSFENKRKIEGTERGQQKLVLCSVFLVLAYLDGFQEKQRYGFQVLNNPLFWISYTGSDKRH